MKSNKRTFQFNSLVLYKGKPYKFVDKQESCLIQPKKGRAISVNPDDLQRHLLHPPKLSEKQKKGLKNFLDSFLKFEKYNSFNDFAKQTKIGDFDKDQIDFLQYQLCVMMKKNHKAFCKILQKA